MDDWHRGINSVFRTRAPFKGLRRLCLHAERRHWVHVSLSGLGSAFLAALCPAIRQETDISDIYCWSHWNKHLEVGNEKKTKKKKPAMFSRFCNFFFSFLLLTDEFTLVRMLKVTASGLPDASLRAFLSLLWKRCLRSRSRMYTSRISGASTWASMRCRWRAVITLPPSSVASSPRARAGSGFSTGQRYSWLLHWSFCSSVWKKQTTFAELMALPSGLMLRQLLWRMKKRPIWQLHRQPRVRRGEDLQPRLLSRSFPSGKPAQALVSSSEQSVV